MSALLLQAFFLKKSFKKAANKSISLKKMPRVKNYVALFICACKTAKELSLDAIKVRYPC